jgi:hypothetical protein
MRTRSEATQATVRLTLAINKGSDQADDSPDMTATRPDLGVNCGLPEISATARTAEWPNATGGMVSGPGEPNQQRLQEPFS